MAHESGDAVGLVIVVETAAERRGKVKLFSTGTINEIFLPNEDPRKTSRFVEELMPPAEAGERLRLLILSAEQYLHAGDPGRAEQVLLRVVAERPHRRMLADALVARGCTVAHLMGPGRSEAHRLHPAARIVEGRVVYDVQGPEQERLPT